uniref:2'-phosphotransferase n=1 Tax=Culicoides sonorensis TaxID=179676 RepID=A0A336K338_CULSO
MAYNKKTYNKDRDTEISKALSYLLRHGALKEGLKIEPDGFINLCYVLEHPEIKRRSVSLSDVQRIVQTNSKNRFTLVELDKSWKIKANQGHSMKEIKKTLTMTDVTDSAELTNNEMEVTQEDVELEEENSRDDLELKQLEEELGDKAASVEIEEKSTEIVSNPVEPTDVKAKLERLRLLRQKKKQRKRARKLQEQTEDPDLKEVLKELESSFDGKEFEVLVRILQPPIKVLKERYYDIRNDMMMALTRYYPQVDIKLFGSCVTDLIFKNSDFDFFVDVPSNEDNNSKLNRVHRLICNSKNFSRPIKISRARTPLIKVTHGPTKTQMDINVSNPLGVFNSEFLRFALSFDPRIKPLAICIKYWARVHHLCGTNLISNYCLVNLLLFYLMNIRDPLFPPVGILQQRVPDYFIGPWNLAFDAHFPNTSKCKLSMIELLEGFFEFYGNFPFETVVVSLYSGKCFPRNTFDDPRSRIIEAERYHVARRRFDLQPFTTTTPVCVQDPFELNCNIGNSININTFKRFRDYCQLAMELFKEFPIATCRASIILKKLFTSTPKVQAPVSLLELMNMPQKKQVCKLEPMQHELAVFNKLFDKRKIEDSTFGRKRFWCDEMVNLLKKMMKEVYLVNLFPFELKRSTEKGQVTLCDCQVRLRANTWSGREKLEFTDKSGLEREIALSKELKQKNPPIHLDAEFTVNAKRERDYIEIEIHEVTGKDENQKILKEFFEGTIIASARSFVKSYSNILMEEEELDKGETQTEQNDEVNKGEENGNHETNNVTN